MDIDIENLQEYLDIKKPEPEPIDPQKMKIYYQHFFPYDLFFTWLGKDNSEYFERREFSFTSDRYLRFQCFKNSQWLKETVLRINPKKIDIGAVYNTLPKMHNQITTDSNAFIPVEKEIVFDIDMTDYDEIRTCCKEAKICDKCWKYMVVAYRVLNAVLREDFGFEKLLWVFSGRRGIHCWVCDDRARKLTNEGRCAIANFIKYKISNVKMGVVPGLKNPLHPSIERAISIIEDSFETIALEEQNILASENGKELLKGLIKQYHSEKETAKIEQFMNEKVEKVLQTNSSSVAKFNSIMYSLKEFEENNKPQKINKRDYVELPKYELIKKDFMLNILYPRLDINVSKHINHLLKSPFCIHPSTGMVSVPLDEESIVNFKVDKIPKLEEIVDSFNSNQENQKFNKYRNIFANFVAKMK